jgi:hypothetical protein
MYKEGCWWEDKDPHAGLIAREADIRLKQSVRYDNMRRLISIYEYGYRSTDRWYNTTYEVPLIENMMTFNHAKNVIDTKVAKVIRSKIVPMVMSEGGNYFQRDRAKKATHGLFGEFDANGIESIKEDVALDMFITGTGLAKVSNDGERIIVDFVPAEDVSVDQAEGRYRKPRSMYQRMYIDRYH